MSEMKGEFTGTWIPAHIMLDESLTLADKFIYATIASFNLCYMSNETLAGLVRVNERSAQRIVKKLKDKGLVEQVSFDGRNRTLRALKDQQGRHDTGNVSEESSITPYNTYNNKSNNNNVTSNDVTNVFNKLREHLKLSDQYKLSDQRKVLIKRRLKDFTPEQIVKAGENLSRSEYHMGDNPQRKKYASVDFLLRSYEKTEEWLLAGEEQATDVLSEAQINEIVERQKASVVYAEDSR